MYNHIGYSVGREDGGVQLSQLIRCQKHLGQPLLLAFSVLGLLQALIVFNSTALRSIGRTKQ